MKDTLPRSGPFSCLLSGVVRGQGPPALFLHGGLLDHRLYGPLVRELAPNRRCVVLDLPGFGQSPPLDEPIELASLADELLVFMDSAGIDAADFVGLSLGAGVALHLAKMAPDRVRTLVLISCSAKPVGPSTQEKAEAQVNLAEVSIPTIAAQFAGTMAGPGDGAEFRVLVETMAGQTKRQSIRALFALIARYPGLEEMIAKETHPLLLMFGAADAAISAPEQHRLAGLASRGSVVAISAAGHLPVLSHPKACAEPILQFWSAET